MERVLLLVARLHLFQQVGEGKEVLKVPCYPRSYRWEAFYNSLRSWHAFGAEDWTVEVFCSGFLVPLHHLPLVLQ